MQVSAKTVREVALASGSQWMKWRSRHAEPPEGFTFLGNGSYGHAIRMPDGRVLKVSREPDDGWRLFAQWQLNYKCPNCIPVHLYDDDEDSGLAWAVIDSAEELSYNPDSGERYRAMERSEKWRKRVGYALSSKGLDAWHATMGGFKRIPRWLRSLREVNTGYFVDTHSGNFLLLRGRVVLSDPFGGSSDD